MFVRWIGSVGLLLLVLGSTPVIAQSTAGAFFHEAARHYIGNDESAAREAVERGLEMAPSDPRLLALRKKLEEDVSSSGGSSRQQGDQGSSSSQSPSGSENQGQASDRPQQDPNGRASDAEQTTEASTQRGQSMPSSPGSGDRNTQGTSEEGSMGPRRDRDTGLSLGQAERLLRALEAQEKTLLREIQTRTGEEHTVEKDW